MENFNLGGIYFTAGLAGNFRAELQRQVNDAIKSLKTTVDLNPSAGGGSGGSRAAASEVANIVRLQNQRRAEAEKLAQALKKNEEDIAKTAIRAEKERTAASKAAAKEQAAAIREALKATQEQAKAQTQAARTAAREQAAAIRDSLKAAQEQIKAQKEAVKAQQQAAKAAEDTARKEKVAFEQSQQAAARQLEYLNRLKSAYATQEVDRLARSANQLRNEWVAGNTTAAQTVTQLNRVEQQARQLAQGYALGSKEAARLAQAQAQAQRTIDAVNGRASAGGLRSAFGEAIQDAVRQATIGIPVLNQYADSAVNLTRAGLATAAAIGGIGLAAVGTARALAASSREAGRYETALQDAEITTTATATQLKELDRLAKTLGPSLAFTPTSAAAAFAELGTQGVEATAILAGAGEATLVLGRAIKNVDLAASIAGQALQVFKLRGEDIAGVADVVANAVNTTALRAEDFNFFIGSGGAAAKAAGLSFAEYTALIAKLRPAFTSAQDAGTSFKVFFQRLAPTVKENVDLMRQYGIDAFDSSGELKKLLPFLDELRQKLDGLTTKQRLTLTKQLFGDDSSRLVYEVLTAKEGFADLEQGLNKLGGAFDTAQKRLDTFEASIEARNATIAKLGTELGESFNPFLKNLNFIFSDNVTAYSDWSKRVSSALSPLFTTLRAGLAPFTVFIDKINNYQPKALRVQLEIEARLKGDKAAVELAQKFNAQLLPGIAQAQGRDPLSSAITGLNQQILPNTPQPTFTPPRPQTPSQPQETPQQRSARIIREAEVIAKAIIAADNKIEKAIDESNQTLLAQGQQERNIAQRNRATFEAAGDEQKDTLERALTRLQEVNRLERERAKEQERLAEERQKDQQRTRTDNLRSRLDGPNPPSDAELKTLLAAEQRASNSRNEIEADGAKARAKILQDEINDRAKKRQQDLEDLREKLDELTQDLRRVVLADATKSQVQGLGDRVTDLLKEAKRLGVDTTKEFIAVANQAKKLQTDFDNLAKAKKVLEKNTLSPGFGDFGAALQAGFATGDNARSLDAVRQSERERIRKEEEAETKKLQDSITNATAQQLNRRLELERKSAQSSNAIVAEEAKKRIELIEAEFKRRNEPNEKAVQERDAQNASEQFKASLETAADTRLEELYTELSVEKDKLKVQLDQAKTAKQIEELGKRIAENTRRLGQVEEERQRRAPDIQELGARTLIAAANPFGDENPFLLGKQELIDLTFTFEQLGLTGTKAYEEIQAALEAYSEVEDDARAQSAKAQDENKQDLEDLKDAREDDLRDLESTVDDEIDLLSERGEFYQQYLETIRRTFGGIQEALSAGIDIEDANSAFPKEFAANLAQAVDQIDNDGKIESNFFDLGYVAGQSTGEGAKAALGEARKNLDKLFLSDQTDLVPPDFSNGSAFAETGDLGEIRQGQLDELGLQTRELQQDYKNGAFTLTDYIEKLKGVQGEYGRLKDFGDLTADQLRELNGNSNELAQTIGDLEEELGVLTGPALEVAPEVLQLTADSVEGLGDSLGQLALVFPEIGEGITEGVLGQVEDLDDQLKDGGITAEQYAERLAELQAELIRLGLAFNLPLELQQKINAALKKTATTDGKSFKDVDEEFQSGLEDLQKAELERLEAERKAFIEALDKEEKGFADAFTFGADLLNEVIQGALESGGAGIADALVNAGQSVAQQVSNSIISNQAAGFATQAAAGGLGAGLSALNPALLGVAIGLPLITGLLGNLFGGNAERQKEQEKAEKERKEGRNRTISTLTFNNTFYLNPSFSGDYSSPESRAFVRDIAKQVATEIYDQRKRIEA